MYCPFKNIWALGFSYLWRCWKVCCWILYDWLYDGKLTFCCLLTQSPGSSESIIFRGVINGKVGKAAALPKNSGTLTLSQLGGLIMTNHWLCFTYVKIFVITPLIFFIFNADYDTESLSLKHYYFYRVLVLHFLPSLATWYLRLFLTSLTCPKIFQSLKLN